MTAPKTDIGTGPQHQFSESRWSQHSETAFKVHLLCRCIKFPLFWVWPTGYKENISWGQVDNLSQYLLELEFPCLLSVVFMGK